VAAPDGTTVLLVVSDHLEVVVGRTAAHPDIGVVEALARLQLAARRLGCSIRLRDPSRELCDLLDLAGLADVIVCHPR
jgi:hypothetical protein